MVVRDQVLTAEHPVDRGSWEAGKVLSKNVSKLDGNIYLKHLKFYLISLRFLNVYVGCYYIFFKKGNRF